VVVVVQVILLVLNWQVQEVLAVVVPVELLLVLMLEVHWDQQILAVVVVVDVLL
jgi:hypothetical protein